MQAQLQFSIKMGQTWLFFVILSMFATTTCKRAINEEPEEPQCYSRFDYDYKVIHHLVTLKEAETELRETITQLQERVSHLEKTIATEVKGKTMERILERPYMFFLSCVCYAFVRVCHLGKG